MPCALAGCVPCRCCCCCWCCCWSLCMICATARLLGEGRSVRSASRERQCGTRRRAPTNKRGELGRDRWHAWGEPGAERRRMTAPAADKVRVVCVDVRELDLDQRRDHAEETGAASRSVGDGAMERAPRNSAGGTRAHAVPAIPQYSSKAPPRHISHPRPSPLSGLQSAAKHGVHSFDHFVSEPAEPTHLLTGVGGVGGWKAPINATRARSMQS